jgi:iron complex transport system ATP-binding protein
VVTIATEALCASLGGRPVLHDVTARFSPGEMIGVIGPNGSGKSTLVRAMLGLVPPTRGAIAIDGRPLADIARGELARRIAYLPQGQDVHWPLGVERLVLLGRLPHLGPLSRVTEADRWAVHEAMARTDVTHLAGRVATELSGGERARVLLARALAVGAPAIVADEPLASLDLGHQMDVMALLRQEVETGSLVVVVLHDLMMAARHCDRLLLMKDGRLVAEGTPEQVLDPGNLERVYGVRAGLGSCEGKLAIIPLERLGAR